MPLDITVSASESERFGLAVGRLTVDRADRSDIDLDDARSLAPFDVVTLRYPTVDAGLFARLLRLPDHDPLFADCLVSRDRGQHVRSPEEVVALARLVFDQVQVTVRHDLLRAPYSHVIIEAS